MAICIDMAERFSNAWENREPLPKETSDVIIYWKKSRGMWYRNCQTMEEGYDKEKVAREGKNSIFIKRGSKAIGYYIVKKKDNFGEDILMMRFFVFYKDRWQSFYDKNSEINFYEAAPTRNCIVFTKDGNAYTGTAYTLIHNYMDITACIPEGCNTITGYSSYTRRLLEDFYETHIVCFKKEPTFMFGDVMQRLHSEKRIISIPNKKQDIINELVKKELPDVSVKDKERIYAIYSSIHGVDFQNVAETIVENQLFAVYQKVEDGIAVRREFLVSVEPDRFDAYHPFKTERHEDLLIREYARTYITDKEVFDCQLYFGKWQYIKQNTKNAKFDFQVIPWEEGSLEGTRAHYFEVINRENQKYIEQTYCHHTDDGMEHHLPTMYQSSVYSIILRIIEKDLIYESFFKTKLDSLKKLVFAQIKYESSENVFRSIFGDIDKRQKSFAKAVGTPMFMLEEVNRALEGKKLYDMTRCNTSYTIRFMKKCLENDREYLKTMDRDTFKAAVDILAKTRIMSKYDWVDLRDVMRVLVKTHGAKNFLNYLRYAVSRISNTYSEEESVFKMYFYQDYLEMLDKMGLTDFQWKFKSAEEIEEAHYRTLHVYNQIKDELIYKKLQNGFDNMKPKWEQYRFANERFCVTPPKSLRDITNEGFALHHCVKTYMDRVAKGTTTILFIRKKSDPDIPFFTLEIRNGAVRQCHGMCNCNIDTVEGLEDFLKDFCEQKQIKMESTNKVLGV